MEKIRLYSSKIKGKDERFGKGPGTEQKASGRRYGDAPFLPSLDLLL
jgi:hypothetical protein